ncbi:MAG TPA: ATP-dependent DNA helicase RecG [Burkholderiales bacterium]|nr:ATP-dependent DNA helicase RecG [Burkholderiales bacterium]
MRPKRGIAGKLAKLGLRTRFDLVLHLPLRYEDETALTPVSQAQPGKPALVQGKVQSAKIVYRPRRQLVVQAEGLALRFFNFYQSQLRQFQRAAEEGLHVRAYGEVRGGWFGAEMAHPRYRVVRPEEPLAEALTPIYPTTAGLPQSELRALILQALDAESLEDTLPAAILERYGLEEFSKSVNLLHRPAPGVDNAAAWRRMKFDELLAQQLSMKLARRARRARRAPALAGGGPLASAFLRRLPFRLTHAQARVLNEVTADLRERHPMQRLLQGDVGSGKTIVAAVACLIAADAGGQAAVMAPTEILSEQHWRKFSEWFAPLGVKMAWLHGRSSGRERRKLLDAQIIVGTHALIQEGVELPRLALAVVDEQHRFGVRQRLDLRRKADDRGGQRQTLPHQLMMSATPIPRTLAMTTYADLDISTIDELPPGRRPVRTRSFSEKRRSEVLARIRDAVAEGSQAYWVCPVIEESKDGLRTAVETHATLSRELKGLRVELLHGRLPAEEKAAIMAGFQAGTIQVLVCTTVIEVGVDVPNASLMVIESAERFGLAQLHQLRGRVGRGTRASDCILLFGEKLSETARRRLKAIYENADGFKLAELDLELRGEGELLGERQSGEPLLRFANPRADEALLLQAQEAALRLLDEAPAAVRRHVVRWLGSRQELAQA